MNILLLNTKRHYLQLFSGPDAHSTNARTSINVDSSAQKLATNARTNTSNTSKSDHLQTRSHRA